MRSLEAYVGPADGQRRLEALGSSPPYYRIVCREVRTAPDASWPEKVEGDSIGVTEFGADNRYIATETPELSSEQSLQRILLVDPAVAKPLESTFSDVKRSPQGASLSGWLKEVGIEDLQLLMDVDGRTPALHVKRAGAVVPLGLAGDGLHSLVHTVLELAAARDGVVLLEEPESFQHPMSLYQTALGIVAGVRRGLQVVLSTHSVELIDALLSHLGEAEAWRAALFTLELRDGELRSSRLAGAELLEARLVRRHGVR